MAPRFNVQSYLAQMREEQREDHAKLVEKVDEGFKAVAKTAADHELADSKQFGAIDKRLSTVENTRRTMRWLGATVIVSLLAAAADFLFVHLPKLIAAAGHP